MVNSKIKFKASGSFFKEYRHLVQGFNGTGYQLVYRSFSRLINLEIKTIISIIKYILSLVIVCIFTTGFFPLFQ